MQLHPTLFPRALLAITPPAASADNEPAPLCDRVTLVGGLYGAITAACDVWGDW